MNTIALDNGTVVTVALSVVLPILVGAVTKMSTHPGIKAVILLLLTAVTGLLTQAVETGVSHFPWGTATLNVALGFIVAVASHFGLWKPTGVTDLAQRNLVKDTDSPALPAAA